MFEKLCIMILLSVATIYPIHEIKELMKKSTEFSFLVQPTVSGGLGVFAAHDIEQGTELRVLKIKDVPAEFLTYCLPLNEEDCACPEKFDRMEIGWYMNISHEHANVNKKLEGQYESILDVLQANTFYATRDIKAGEEILIDVESVKKHFPRK